MRLTLVLTAVIFTLATSLTGCAVGRPSRDAAAQGTPQARRIIAGPEQATAPIASQPGTTVAGYSFDRAVSATEYASAYAAARDGLPRVLKAEYLGSESARQTPQVSSLLKRVRLELAPVCAVTTPAPDPSTVFANTVAIRGQYIALLWDGDRLLGAYDWGADQQPDGWGSFYSSFALDFKGAASQLRRELGSQPMRVRFVKAPHGCWMVGRSGSKELASFVADQGFYEDVPAGLSSPQQVLAYTTRDHSSE